MKVHSSNFLLNLFPIYLPDSENDFNLYSSHDFVEVVKDHYKII